MGEGQLLSRKQLVLATMLLLKRAGGKVTISIEELQGLEMEMMKAEISQDQSELTLQLKSKQDAILEAAATGEAMETIEDD